MGSHTRQASREGRPPVLKLNAAQLTDGMSEFEPRVDGASGSGDAWRKRGSRASTVPVDRSLGQHLESFVASKFVWELGDELESLVPEYTCGRPRGISGACVALYLLAAEEARSLRKAEREFRDPIVWNRLCIAASRWGDAHPGRRLPLVPPSRSQFHRFQRRYLSSDEAAAAVRDKCRELSAEALKVIGAFDPTKGTLTHPDPASMLTGDGTWLRAMFNRPPDDVLFDEHGERTRRVDPDAVPQHPGDVVVGRQVVLAIGETGFPNERVIADVAVKPLGGTDADMFVEMVRELSPLLNVTTVGYDMAMDAENQDDLLQMGIVPVVKVRRNRLGEKSSRPLGVHTVTLADGSKRQVPVFAYDGHVALDLGTPDEPNRLVLNHQQMKKSQLKSGCKFHIVCKVPSDPEVPRRWRGATTVVRLTSLKSEIASGTRRTTVLRAFPEGTPTFDELFGQRETNESANDHFKARLHRSRARCVGVNRWQLMLCAYQGTRAITALLAWHHRTGGDISAWFGDWQPPPERGSKKA